MPTVKKEALTKAPKKPASLGVQIDAIFKTREELRALQEQEKEVEARIREQELVLMETMEREGVDRSTGKLATVSISETLTGNVVDWDVFWAFVFKTKAAHLLQRRISDPAVRELFETKGAVPGVEPFKKRKLNIRKVA